MKLGKIDLTKIVAIGHEDGQLGLLIDRGEEMEYIEISAPVAAYRGLQQIAFIANNEIGGLPDSCEEAEELEGTKEIPMLPVSSSVARAIGYDEERQVLQIEFASGSVYQYADVEPETWESLCDTDSIGRFFNQEIKGCYESERLDEEWEIEITCD